MDALIHYNIPDFVLSNTRGYCGGKSPPWRMPWHISTFPMRPIG